MTCTHASISDIAAAVTAAKGSDYSLVVFIGQGKRVIEDRPWKETRIDLSNTESILAERQLNTEAPRLTMVLDCCSDDSDLLSASHNFRFGKTTLDMSKKSAIRLAYDTALQTAEKGFVKILQEPAEEGSFSGSYFSPHLICMAKDWAIRHKVGSILTLNDIKNDYQVNDCQQSMASNGVQFIYRGGRRLKHFPFAIGFAPKELP